MVEIVLAGKQHARDVFLLTLEFFPYINPSEELVLERMESGNVFYLVAVEGESVIGFVDLEVGAASKFGDLHELKEGLPVVEGKQGKILGLAVRKEFQGKGLGKRLFQASLDLAREKGVEAVVLLVVEGNVQAQKLYVEFGFEKKGVLQREISGKRVLLYSKKL